MSIPNTLKAAIAVISLGGGATLALPASATQAAPLAANVVAATVASCGTPTALDRDEWDVRCRVYSGWIRARTTCLTQDAITTHYGDWVGKGSWTLGGWCSEGVLQSYGVERA